MVEICSNRYLSDSFNSYKKGVFKHFLDFSQITFLLKKIMFPLSFLKSQINHLYRLGYFIFLVSKNSHSKCLDTIQYWLAHRRKVSKACLMLDCQENIAMPYFRLHLLQKLKLSWTYCFLLVPAIFPMKITQCSFPSFKLCPQPFFPIVSKIATVI